MTFVRAFVLNFDFGGAEKKRGSAVNRHRRVNECFRRFSTTSRLKLGLRDFGVYYLSKRSVNFGACFLQRVEIRFLSGIFLNNIAYFSDFFSHAHQIGFLSGFCQRDLRSLSSRWLV